MKVGFWENKNPLVGAHLGPIWGGTLGALGPIWGGSSGRPKADILEAEGRHYGGRRPTKWRSGGEAPRKLGPLGPMGPIWPYLAELWGFEY